MARARSPELPDALRGACADPIGRGTQRLCALLHELRAPRQLPRDRARVPTRELEARFLLLTALLPAPRHRVRDALPRWTTQRRHARRIRHAIAACVALPASHLHARHAGHDGLGGRRRSRVRHLPSPACLPSRHHRKHPRDRPLHDRLDPPTAPGRLDTRCRRSLRSDDRPARNTTPLGGSRVGHRTAGRAVADLWRSLVSLLSGGRGSTPARRKNADLREREPTPIHLDPGGSGERTALLRLPVSSHPGQPAGRGAHRRGRLRQRRRPRSRPRSGACRRGRDRPGPPGVGSRAPSEPAVSGPAGPCSRGGWPSVPRAERSEI